MASSNRHWPSMFKSKPCNTHHRHHQWQHHDIDTSLISTGCHRAPYSSGCEERSPEPKPRWNPKPEQIRILEAIFNSGMVNPPRDEIRKIRAQLQEYGQVGDANVFYWFQNRKSRSKHKQRHLQQASKSSSSSQSTSQQVPAPPPQQQTPPITTKSLSSSSSCSSSSSEKSSPNSQTFPITSPVNLINISPSINQGINFHTHNDQFVSEQFLFPMVQPSDGLFTQGFCSNFPDMSTSVGGHVHVHVPEHHHHPSPHQNLFLTELMNQCASSRSMGEHEEKLMKLQMQRLASYTVITTTTPPSNTNTVVAPPLPPSLSDTTITVTVPSSSITQVQGVGETTSVPAKSTVFINGVAFEVSVGPLNVREAFGEDAVLIHSSGQPVLTDEWGLTLHSLQHGSSYYLIWSLSLSLTLSHDDLSMHEACFDNYNRGLFNEIFIYFAIYAI